MHRASPGKSANRRSPPRRERGSLVLSWWNSVRITNPAKSTLHPTRGCPFFGIVLVCLCLCVSCPGSPTIASQPASPMDGMRTRLVVAIQMTPCSPPAMQPPKDTGIVQSREPATSPAHQPFTTRLCIAPRAVDGPRPVEILSFGKERLISCGTPEETPVGTEERRGEVRNAESGKEPTTGRTL